LNNNCLTLIIFRTAITKPIGHVWFQFLTRLVQLSCLGKVSNPENHDIWPQIANFPKNNNTIYCIYCRQ